VRQFFIVGCPRSGTTMVQQALNRHPQVAIPPETKFFFSFYGTGLRSQTRHLQRLNGDLGVHLRLPPRGVRTPDEARSFFSELANRYVTCLGRSNVEFFGEKTPEHTSRLDLIREVFPDAKIVFIYRDGRDVALSLSQVPWMVPDPCVGICIWLYYYGVMRQAWESEMKGVAFFRYEDLVSKPRETFQTLLEFVGADFDERVIQGFGNAAGIPVRELAWKRRALEPINSDRVGSWRMGLRADDLAVIERISGTVLSYLGYTLLTDGQTPLTLARLATLGWGAVRFAAQIPRCILIKEAIRLATSAHLPIIARARPSRSWQSEI